MKHLKLFFALFAMLALGVGNAWGSEVTLTGDYTNGGPTGWSQTGTKKTGYWQLGTDGNYIQSPKFSSAAGGVVTVVFEAYVTGSSKSSDCQLIGLDSEGNTVETQTVTCSSTNMTSAYPTTSWVLNNAENNIQQIKFIYKKATSSNMRVRNVKITYNSGSEEPVLSATPKEIDFGTVYQGTTVEDKTVAVNFENLKGAVKYTGLSTPFTATGTISNDGDKITIAANTTTIDEYSQTLTIASVDDDKSVEVVVKMNVIAPFEGKKLVFDFVTHPSGWPAAKANATAGSYVYTLDEVDYTFSHTKSGDGIYLGGTSKTSGYLMLASGNKLGLPAIKGYKLVKVDGTLNGSGTPSTASQVSITNAGGTVISGGAAQTWDTKGGTKTYNLTDTEANTVYYLTVANKNLQMITLALYYEEVAGAADIPDAPTLTASQTFEAETFTVEISAVDGATIHYTLDGSDPTEASTTYSAPFTVNATTTVKAIAVKDGVASNVATATYTKVIVIEKTCAEAAALCTSDESTDKYRVEGYVTAIETAYSAQYNNITVWMADTRNGGKVLQAYRATPTVEADKAVKVGDQIEVVGKLKLYNSVPEIVSGTYTITQLDPVYNVNITSAHGTVTATPAPAVEGTEITLSVEVEIGWVFQSWTVTDASSNSIEVTDNKFTMPASDVTVVANYTESVAADAVLKLSANGVVTSNTYKVGETVKLPETIVNDCVKMFVGWSAGANCATTPEYAPGADFELTAEEHTLYAVYASGTTGETVTIKHNVPTTGTSTNMTGNNDANKFFGLDADAWSVVAAKGGASNNVGINKDGTIRLYYHVSGGNTLTVTAPSKVATIKLTYNGTYTNAWVKVNGNKVTPTDGVYTIDAETFVIGNANTENVQVHIKNIAVTLAGALADFSTTCTGALAAPTFSVAEGEYTEAQSITLSAAEGTIYYTLDGTKPTSASTQYSTPIVLDECGEFTIKAIAIGTESESPVASATYTINLPITNTEATAYTPAEAIAIIDGACDKTEEVFVKGVVVSTTGLNTEYGNYDKVVVKAVDDESATPTEFTFFRLFKAAEKTKFTTSDEVIGVGDIITAKGKLTKYNTTYELAEGCYMVERVANVKLESELAWNPETVTLTVGDAFTAPTLNNPHSVVGITYESSNDEVATVSAEGVIALVDDAVGTVTITATFAGDATYKPAEVTCTIKVKPIQEDCEGSDDFETLEVNSGYATRTTTGGWKATHAAVAEIEGSNYIIINGKTSTVGTITSPELNGGIGSIKIRYANTYNEDHGVSFRLDIKQNGEVVKTYTITKANEDVVKGTVYTELIKNINIAGDFQMVFTNLSPSNSTSNKDRVSIGRLCWTGYEEVVTPTLTITEGENTLTDGVTADVTVNRSFEKDKLYTISLPFALGAEQVETIFGAGTILYQFAQLVKENGELVLYFSTPSAIAAATPYLIQPTQDVATGFTVEDAVISTTPNNISFSVDATTITMMPILSADRTTTNGSTEYWLAADRILYNDANTLLSLRALFNISTVSGMPPRCRVALGENVETGIDNITTGENTTIKLIENGQLIIIRDGVKYNVQGQKL